MPRCALLLCCSCCTAVQQAHPAQVCFGPTEHSRSSTSSTCHAGGSGLSQSSCLFSRASRHSSMLVGKDARLHQVMLPVAAHLPAAKLPCMTGWPGWGQHGGMQMVQKGYIQGCTRDTHGLQASPVSRATAGQEAGSPRGSAGAPAGSPSRHRCRRPALSLALLLAFPPLLLLLLLCLQELQGIFL